MAGRITARERAGRVSQSRAGRRWNISRPQVRPAVRRLGSGPAARTGRPSFTVCCACARYPCSSDTRAPRDGPPAGWDAHAEPTRGPAPMAGARLEAAGVTSGQVTSGQVTSELLDLSLGCAYSAALHTAARFDIADHLADSPRTADALAAAAGVHGPHLYRLLRFFAAKGDFREDDEGRFPSRRSPSPCARTRSGRCGTASWCAKRPPSGSRRAISTRRSAPAPPPPRACTASPSTTMWPPTRPSAGRSTPAWPRSWRP